MNDKGSTLQAPDYLENQFGDYMSSPSASYFAVIQDDGNFCVYAGAAPPRGSGVSAAWCSNSNQPCNGIFYVAMQTDGNLCIYVGTPDYTIGNAIWCSQSNTSVASYFLKLDDTGVLSVWSGSPDFPVNQIWP